MEQKKFVQKNEMTAFCVAGLGQGMIYALMSSYISDYYLNVLQLTPMFVLLLMLLARVWDAINDPLMGMIVDRSNLKSGKMLPFIRFALIPIAVVTLLMYLSPNLDKTQMMIYSAIVYVAWGMIYTVGDVSFWGLPNVMTPDSEERSSVISVSKIYNSIGSAVGCFSSGANSLQVSIENGANIVLNTTGITYPAGFENGLGTDLLGRLYGGTYTLA